MPLKNGRNYKLIIYKMKTLNDLPEKFAFKLDKIGKKWVRETFGTNHYDDTDYDFFHYPNHWDNKGFKSGHHGTGLIREGYTEIPTSDLFPDPQIPTIKKGVMMLVWDDDEKEAKEKEVMFFDGTHYHAKSSNNYHLVSWKNAKPIPQLPEFTIEEAEQKFNIKIKK